MGSLLGEELSYRVLDINGKLIQQRILAADTQEADLSDFPKGMYFLVLSSGEAYKLIRQ